MNDDEPVVETGSSLQKLGVVHSVWTISYKQETLNQQ